MAKKKKEGRSSHPKKLFPLKNFLVVVLVIALVAGSFLIGIGLGYVKKTEGKDTNYTVKVAVEKKIFQKIVLPTASIKIPILVYHYVEYVKDARDTIRKSLDILPPTLELQIKTLKDAGYTFITAAEIGQYLDGIKPLPEKPIVLTFDDGYGDFYTDVFPILKKYNVVTTEYIISGFIGKPNYMTLDQVKEISESGLVEIGAHTVHHPNLKSVPLDHAKKEIVDSKKDLEEMLGIKVVSFAYPYGGFNSDVANLVKEAGFTNAVTTKGGLVVNQENRFTLFRIHAGAATRAGLLSVL